MDSKIEEMDKKIREYLGVSIDELTELIVNQALWIEKDNSKAVLLKVFGERHFSITIIQKGASFERNGEEFTFEFSIIDPWDVSGFEDVYYDSDNNIYVDDLYDTKYTEDELLEETFFSAIDGDCPRFENEFNKFLYEFDKYLKIHYKEVE